MKITIVHTYRHNPSPEVKHLLIEAKKLHITCEIKTLDLKRDVKSQITSFGDIVIWRMKKLPLKDIVNRKILLDSLGKRKIFNFSIDKAWSSNKLTQQNHLATYTKISTIPTYKFHTKADFLTAIKNKTLQFPFIQKIALGCKGKGVSLIHNEKDIASSEEISKYVYQNYIPNDGDYRVIVLGGKVLGCIKRIAASKEFRNNLSQGANAEAVTSPSIIKELHTLALRIASAFNLTFCGIDIIYDKKENKYIFLEINSLPEWQPDSIGFQRVTGVNVAREVLLYCKSMFQRENKKTPELIKKYFIESENYIDKGQMFHFYSRMYLWTNNLLYKSKIKKYKSVYLRKTQESLSKIVKTKPIKERKAKGPLGDLRKEFYQKHFSFEYLEKSLFHIYIIKILYHQNMIEVLQDHLSDIACLYQNLLKDKKAIAMFSTYAINFFYQTDYLLGDKIKNHKAISLTPQFFLEIAQSHYESFNNKSHPVLQLYLLSHCIINESVFYTQKITKNRKTYLSMLQLMEKIINEHYFELSLDNKLEFLTCTKILQYHSYLEAIILQEAKNSLSDHGNYLIDKLNNKKSLTKDNLYYAEHRNTLYLMAQNDYRF